MTDEAKDAAMSDDSIKATDGGHPEAHRRIGIGKLTAH